MFVLSRDVSAAKRVIATLLATAIVLWASGAMSYARAANITDVSDTLSDSAPGAASNHNIEFSMSTTGSVAPSGGIIDITLPGAFTLGSVAAGDIDILVNTVNDDANWTVSFPGGNVIRFTAGAGGGLVASDDVQILIGTNATAGTNQITNPASPAGGNESYEIDISAGTDSGHTRVVILDTVLVTATVDTIFEFTVNGLGSGIAVNGTTTNAVSSSTTIPFGTLTAYEPVTLAQNLQVLTNAINGYVVTIQSDGALRSSTGADIDEFRDDDTGGDVPEVWESPSVGLDINDENTWGHWGITTEDNDADGMRDGDEFGSNEWIGVSTTPRQIMAHDGPADNVTTSVGSTTIGFQVEISPLQEAADDYATTLTYIATPTF